ncbi:MAG: diacylglycerol kinase [Gammaproteobacteria bacterium]
MGASKNQPLAARVLFACAGLVHGARSERSLQLQLIAFGVMLIALTVLRPEPVWWALVVGSSALVIAAEMFNTAIEALADHLHPEIHPSIRIVKDCAAGAVLVASLGAVGVGVALVAHLCAGRT